MPAVTTTAIPAPAYRLRCRRWVGLSPIAFALVLAPLVYTPFLPAAATTVLALVVAGIAIRGVMLFLRPPAMVRVDDAGLTFDGRRAGWDQVEELELRETVLGLRLRARVPGDKLPRLFQPLVPVPLDQVVHAVQVRRPVTVTLLTPTLLAPRRRLIFATLATAVVLTLATTSPLPGGVRSGPSTAVDVAARLNGAADRPGAVLVLPVQESSATLLDVIQAALDDDVDVAWQRPSDASRTLRAPGGAERRSLAEQAALAAGLACIGRPVGVAGGDLRVRSFRPAESSSGLLEPGDRVVAAGGRPVAYVEDVYAAAEGLRPGDRLTIEGRSADGRSHHGTLAIRSVDGAPAPWGIGFDVSPIVLEPPSAVSLDLGGLSGSSAGLAGALGVVDALGPGPLAAGRRIAVTGTISPDGRVGPIASLRYKAATARHAGATVLVVPATQAAAARRYAPTIAVIGVNTLAEAVVALGGQPCAS